MVEIYSKPLSHLHVVLRGLDPRIHAFASAAEDVDAHGTSPWAEGPRAKSGQDENWGLWRLLVGDEPAFDGGGFDRLLQLFEGPDLDLPHALA